MDEKLTRLLKTDNDNALVSYFAGLYTISQLFDAGDHIKQIKRLMGILEVKKAKFSEEELNIISSFDNSREYLINFADNLIESGDYGEAIGVLEICLGEFNKEKLAEKSKDLGQEDDREITDSTRQSLIDDDELANNKVKRLSEITDDDIKSRIEECRRKVKGIITTDEINHIIKEIMHEDEDLNADFFPKLVIDTPLDDEKDIPVQDKDENIGKDEEIQTEEQLQPHDSDKHEENNQRHHRDYTKADINQFLTNDQIIKSAQKHAKLGISALNFEDVPTAIENFRLAIDVLQKYQQIEP